MRGWLLAALIVGAAASVYNFGDALRDSAPNGRGAEAVYDLLSFIEGPRLSMDEPTKDFFAYVEKSIGDFDFGKFYGNKYLRPLAGGYKGVVLQGTRGTAAYNVRLSMSDVECMEPNGLGNFIAEFGLKKTAGRSYLGRVKAKAGTAALSHNNVTALATGLMKVVSPENMKAIQAFKGRDTRHIPEEALQVIHEFYKAFPRFANIFKKYVYIYHSTLKRDSAGGQEFTRSTVRAFFRMDEITRDFPALSDYIKEVRGFFRLHAVARNRQGHILADFLLEAKEDFLSLAVLTKDGKLIPYDAKGAPVFAEAVALNALTDYAFDVSADLDVDVYGLKFDTPDIRVACRFRDAPKSGTFEARLSAPPRTTVSGKLAGVAPPWLLSLAIPSDIASQVNAFTDVLYRANSGEGTYLRVFFDTTHPDDVVMRLNAGTEFADNFFLGFALAVLSHRLHISDGVVNEALMFFHRAASALRDDVDTYRPARAKPGGK